MSEKLDVIILYNFIIGQIQSLTADGGKLKCSVPLVRGRDFEIVPESVWKALVQWYTGSPALPRNVSSMNENLT
jgi:hypothetical protein